MLHLIATGYIDTICMAHMPDSRVDKAGSCSNPQVSDSCIHVFIAAHDNFAILQLLCRS